MAQGAAELVGDRKLAARLAHVEAFPRWNAERSRPAGDGCVSMLVGRLQKTAPRLHMLLQELLHVLRAYGAGGC